MRSQNNRPSSLPSDDKQKRKEQAQGVKSAERQKAEAELPAPKEKLQGLFDYLDQPARAECDHTLRYSREYIKQHDLDEEQVVDWLRSYGGTCDCEVRDNVQDACPVFHARLR